jgi:6-oxo-cyclohex-1-ene-carbonyl-CoA hydrolase
MSLNWLPKDNEIKNHDLWGDEFFDRNPPSVIYELKPVVNSEGNKINGFS